jgi:hypothetical protein
LKVNDICRDNPAADRGQQLHLYSINSSALASSDGGTVRPSAFAEQRPRRHYQTPANGALGLPPATSPCFDLLTCSSLKMSPPLSTDAETSTFVELKTEVFR